MTLYRVITAAVGRLYTTVTLIYIGPPTVTMDTTYKFSATLLWAFVECTCIFIVFCVPTIPKLFAEMGIISRITSSFRSWGSPSSKESKNGMSVHTIGSPPKRKYRLGDEESNAHGSLTELTMVRDKDGHQAGGQDGWLTGSGIVKTVEIDNASSETSLHTAEKRQYPWMEEAGPR